MADDQSGQSPRPGFPIWVWGVGVGAVVLILWYRNRSKGSAASDYIQGPISGVPATGGTDPYSGLPIDPMTGLPFLNSSTGSSEPISVWISRAGSALKEAGYSPSLIASALYNYTNGEQLNDMQSSLIDRAFGLVGFPSQLLPFYGKPPVKDDRTSPLVKITADDWKHLSKAAEAQWQAYTSPAGAHLYIPKVLAPKASGLSATPLVGGSIQYIPATETTVNNGARVLPV